MFVLFFLALFMRVWTKWLTSYEIAHFAICVVMWPNNRIFRQKAMKNKIHNLLFNSPGRCLFPVHHVKLLRKPNWYPRDRYKTYRIGDHKKFYTPIFYDKIRITSQQMYESIQRRGWTFTRYNKQMLNGWILQACTPNEVTMSHKLQSNAKLRALLMKNCLKKY